MSSISVIDQILFSAAFGSSRRYIRKITPVVGSDLLTDGGLNVWTDATDLTHWGESTAGTSTINREDVLVSEGDHAVRMDIDASNSSGVLAQAVVASINDWILIEYSGASAPTGKQSRIGLEKGGSVGGASRVVADTYKRYTELLRSTWANPNVRLLRSSAASSSLYFDDVRARVISFPSCFATPKSTADGDVDATAKVSVPEGAHGGVVINLDSLTNPLNGVFAFVDRNHACLWALVNGTWTYHITSAAITYVDHAPVRVRKVGTTYKLYYNGVQVSTDRTISDATIVDNTIHCQYATEGGVIFSDYTVMPPF